MSYPRLAPLQPSHCRSQSRSSFTSVDTADDSSDKLSDAKAQVSPAPSIASVSTADDAGDTKARRQDWKLDAQELSLIRREEERVMKPDVLGRLLAAGAGLGCERAGSRRRGVWCGGGVDLVFWWGFHLARGRTVGGVSITHRNSRTFGFRIPVYNYLLHVVV